MTAEQIAMRLVNEWNKRFSVDYVPECDISDLSKIIETEIKNARNDGAVAFAGLSGTFDNPTIQKILREQNVSDITQFILDQVNKVKWPEGTQILVEGENEVKADDADDEEECTHWEHDHGHCLDCGEDITQSLVARAEAMGEGDR